jgi:hypothetical protein
MPDTYSPASYGPGGIGQFNPPDLNAQGRPTNKPISSAQQAYSLYLRFKKQNRARANRNKVIQDVYNGKSPYDQRELDDQNQGWRSNMSTQFLSSIVDRVTPRFTGAIHDLKYLTAAELPDSYDDYQNKSELYQMKTTELIRKWSSWTDFVQRVVTEDVLQGYTAAMNIDEHNWRPRTYRQEDVYFDEQTSQDVHRLDCFCIEQDFYIHELISLLEEPETTERAGFNIENLKFAIEHAMPPREDLPSDPRQLSDMAREASLYFSWHKASKMVQTVHVFVRNYTGGIDHWWVNRGISKSGQSGIGSMTEDTTGGGEELFFGDSVANLMEDIITLFTFQAGNDRLFGSKGLGRLLVNIAISIERERNLYFDQQYIAGLLIGTAEEKDIPFLAPKVVSPFLILPKGMELMAQQMQFNPEAFAGLDNKLTAISEIIAGTFIPEQVSASGQVGQSDKTATEATIDATREEEIRQGILNRWWNQFTHLISQMQRRIYTPLNIRAALAYAEARDEAIATGLKLVDEEMMKRLLQIDPAAGENYTTAPPYGRADGEAVQTIVALLDAGLSPDEILLLAYTPATEYNTNVGAIEDSKLLQFASVAQGNPYWDQGKLNFEGGAAMIGYRRAKDLFVGDPSMSTNLEQQRAQYSEYTDMTQGQAMPVSDRDDHVQHNTALVQKVFASLNTMRSIPPEVIPEQDLNTMKLALMHGEAHVQAENKKNASIKSGGRGKRTKEMQPLAAQLTEANKVFEGILNNRAKAQAAQAMANPMNPQMQPPAHTMPGGMRAPLPPGAQHGVGGLPTSLPPATPNPAPQTTIPA